MKFCLSIALFLLCNSLFAQPIIEWQKCLGGSNYDAASSVQQTQDGGYVVFGLTQSNNGDVSNNQGSVDFWVTKLNSLGELQWQKALGGSSVDVGIDLQQTSDEGFVVCGFTLSNNGDVSENHGNADCWVVKLNNTGTIQWQKSLGGSKEDHAQCIRQTTDGGYIMVGYTASEDGDVSGNHGQYDFWVVKLNPSGIIQWQKALGGSEDDEAYSVQQTNDGGYIIAGKTFSNNGDVSESHGDFDYWVVKLDQTGTLEWQKTFGGSGSDDGGIVYPTSDGGYIVAGTTGSNDGQVTNVHGDGDGWIVKLDQTGTLQWQKALGGSDHDSPSSIFQSSDGGYILSILTLSVDGDVLNNDGGAEMWVVKISPEGNIIWQKTYGGSQAEVPGDLQPTSDGGYIMCGYTWSNNGDVSGNHGTQDFWVVKLSPSSTPTTSTQPSPLEIYPNPTHQLISVQLPDSFPTENGDVFPLSIRITDLPGREVMRQTIESEAPLNIKAIPNGLYLLTATTNSGKVFSGKFVKQE